MSFFEELNRRIVFHVGIAYGVTAWLLIQISDTVFPRIGLSESAVTLVIALLAIGFVPALIFTWAFEGTPKGIKREHDIGRAESIMPQTAKKLDRVIMLTRLSNELPVAARARLSQEPVIVLDAPLRRPSPEFRVTAATLGAAS